MKRIKIMLFLVIISPQFVFGQKSKDVNSIHNIINTMMEAWEEGDGEKFASVFASPHDFIVWNGFYFRQIDINANATNHNNIFSNQLKGTKVYYVVDKIKFVKKKVILIHVFGALDRNNQGMPPNPSVLWTGLLVKKKGKWKIISFHNSNLEIYKEDGPKGSPIPVEQMYQSWFNAIEKMSNK